MLTGYSPYIKLRSHDVNETTWKFHTSFQGLMLFSKFLLLLNCINTVSIQI